MLGILRKFFKGDEAAERDARLIYDTLMTQARDRRFYGQGRIPDTLEGRLETLVMHIAPVMDALSSMGEQGQLLSQALFDTMRADFDTALREQGYSDSGVKRRIKPMIQRFYAGLDAYAKALREDDNEALEVAIATDLEDMPVKHAKSLADYLRSFRESLGQRSLGEIASARMTFPPLPL